MACALKPSSSSAIVVFSGAVTLGNTSASGRRRHFNRRHDSVSRSRELPARLGSCRSSSWSNYTTTTTREHLTNLASPDHPNYLISTINTPWPTHNLLSAGSSPPTPTPPSQNMSPKRSRPACKMLVSNEHHTLLPTLCTHKTNNTLSSTSQPAPPTSPTSAS